MRRLSKCKIPSSKNSFRNRLKVLSDWAKISQKDLLWIGSSLFRNFANRFFWYCFMDRRPLRNNFKINIEIVRKFLRLLCCSPFIDVFVCRRFSRFFNNPDLGIRWRMTSFLGVRRRLQNLGLFNDLVNRSIIIQIIDIWKIRSQLIDLWVFKIITYLTKPKNCPFIQKRNRKIYRHHLRLYPAKQKQRNNF